MTIATEKETFQGIPLKEILSPPTRSSEDELREVSRIVAMLGGPEGREAYDFERTSLENLCQRKAALEYPTIDLSFLAMKSHGNVKVYPPAVNPKVKLCQLPLPRFGVYGLDKERDTFEVYFNTIAGGLEQTWIEFRAIAERSPTIIMPERENREMYVPQLFSDQLIQSMGHSPKLHFPQYYCSTKDLCVKEVGSHSFHMRSTFSGILPQSTRDRVERAKETFRGRDLYLVAEVKPEDWSLVVARYNDDPLVVGVAGKKAYLIDCFDTTSIEAYVKSEFLTNA